MLSELRALAKAGATAWPHVGIDADVLLLLLDVAEAASVGCRNCSYEDDDAELCRDEAGCGFADAKAALARLKEEK